jgi:predicted CoA-binding protein
MDKRVAVLGASRNRAKFGNKSLRAHAQAGYAILPVNPDPTLDEIEGWKTYHRLEDLPKGLERVVVYLPPPVTLAALDGLATLEAKEIWLNPGTADAAVVARAAELGLPTVQGCSIVDLGLSPSQFPA